MKLQAYFDCIDWSIFEAAATDLDELTDSVTSYTVSVSVRIYASLPGLI